jgi:AcrR family transcriptional regulator
MKAGTLADSAIPVPQRLLAVATGLFATKGFDRTSVQEIVDAAQVTKGAMYHYFGSKEDLLGEIYRQYLNEQMERLERFASSDASLTRRIHDASVDVVTSTISNFEAARIFTESMHMLSPEVRRSVRSEQRKYHERFRSLIEEGQRLGILRPDIPADLVVEYFFGSVHHLTSWYRRDGVLSVREVGEYYAELLLSSLRPSA